VVLKFSFHGASAHFIVETDSQGARKKKKEWRRETAGTGIKENARTTMQVACNAPDTTKPVAGLIQDGLVL